MNRTEAVALIGKPVAAWSGLWGQYIGELVEVTRDRPWRGRVRIRAVVEYPVQGRAVLAMGFRERRPYAEGEVHDFGAVNIRPHGGEIPPYTESLRAALVRSLEQHTSACKYERQRGDPTGVLAVFEKAVVVLATRLAELDAVVT